ncbi:MAG: cell envelope integrity protein CreD [Aliishimia sp.]
MLRSAGFRFFSVGVLTLLMSIPALYVADIINERAEYSRQTARDLGREWGGPQTLTGPVIMIPVEETVTVSVRKPVLDPVTGIQPTDEHGTLLTRVVDETRIESREPVFVLPNVFSAHLKTLTQTRYRGFFSIPVYTAEAGLEMTFDFSDVETVVPNGQRILWADAELRARVSSNRSLRGEAVLMAGETQFKLEPLVTTEGTASGFSSRLGDPRDISNFNLSLGLFGANSLMISPVGRSSSVQILSDWPHPSFTGAFLPNEKDITDTGFTADWSIPHIARSMPQIARFDPTASKQVTAAFGVSFYQPNDFYQKSYRAARYGMMFIALTFLAIFLMDGRRETPTHPVQYVLIGLAQLTFFLLMVALAEQLGFAMAYSAAGAATVGLITMFAGLALRLGKRTALLGGILALLYGVLYLILESADYALLAGAILAFVSIAATMFGTRNEKWSSGENVLTWFSQDPKPPAPK